MLEATCYECSGPLTITCLKCNPPDPEGAAPEHEVMSGDRERVTAELAAYALSRRAHRRQGGEVMSDPIHQRYLQLKANPRSVKRWSSYHYRPSKRAIREEARHQIEQERAATSQAAFDDARAL